MQASSMDRMTPIQKAALMVGGAFILVGVLGFVPGITTDFDAMEFAGPDSQAMLLGIFQVSVLHNLVHLGLGLWGLAAARGIGFSRIYLIGAGAGYGALAVYGLLIDKESAVNFVPVNTADDWLHVVLAVVMVGLGVSLSSPGRTRRE